ncbi:MAG: carbohydrate ABC transporter permease [Chloroflexi bacterium]|nr:carbohydrate ABC transporter permease [Chloroflexota bacterium]
MATREVASSRRHDDTLRAASHGIRILLVYVFLVALAALTVAPFMMMVSIAFTPGLNFMAFPMPLLPQNPGLGNFQALFESTKILRWTFNSVFVSVSLVALHLFTCSLAGYAFARGHFRGRDAIFWLFMGTLMMPESVTIVPLFILLGKVGWINTYYALIVPRATSIFGTFLLRQYFSTISREFDDAATMDGANRFRIFSQILAPLAKPAIATLATLSFLSSWNSFMFPLIVTSKSTMQVLSVGIATMVRREGAAGFQMAGATVTFLPTFIVFLLMQRHLTSGLALGGLKG